MHGSSFLHGTLVVADLVLIGQNGAINSHKFPMTQVGLSLSLSVENDFDLFT